MATTTIPWGDGSGQNIYLTYPSASGNQTVSVSSDANTGSARSKVVTFSATGVSPVTLTVNQEAGVITPIFYDKLIFDGTAYIDTTYVLPSQCSIRVKLGNETTKAAQRVFWVGNSTDGYLGMIYGGSTSSTRRQIVPYYDYTSYNAGNRYINFSTTSFSYFMTPTKFGYGGTSWTYTTAAGTTHPNYGLVFGSNTAHSGTTYTGKMETFYVYGSDAKNVNSYSGFDSYTPVATFRPCTYGGVAGMWYVEGNTFFGNSAGSGTLTVANN